MTDWTDWETVERIPRLGANQVQVIAVPLDLAPQTIKHLQRSLSTVELIRANRFVFPEHRRRFVACRGILRYFLGLHLGREPASVNLRIEEHGKPQLAELEKSPIRFNLTHSKELAVFAFALSLEVGIDIEEVSQDRNVDEIAVRYFSGRENSELAAVLPQDRLHAFYRCWTRKEAYLKARGDGLAVPLDSFAVTLLPDDPPALFTLDSARWTISSISPSADFVGAVVCEGTNPNLITMAYRPA
jgi:4'-phosphopantetheinyl transferase